MTPHPTLADVDAVLLDMDGTIVDSTPAVERAWAQLAVEQGLAPDAVLASCHGRAAADTIAAFLPALAAEEVAALAARHLDRELRDLDGVVPIDGATDLLAACDAAGVPWAVVTSCPRPLAVARLKAAGIDAPLLVTADDVERPKPAPDPFLLAARVLGVAPQRCLVLEDSPSGLAAALAAGATAVRVGPGGDPLRAVVARLAGGRAA